jgi:hypothetical protein
MSIAQIQLDESTKLDFGVSITGADGKPEARFIIEGKDFDVSFPATQTQEGVEVDIKGLKSIFTAGEYNARLEIVLENKIYTPLIDKIEFLPSIQISTNSVKTPVKESVKVSKVVVTKAVVNENELRKTQAATIIANSLHYHPTENQTPAEIVNSALAQSGPLTNEQIETVKEMLDLAESVGIMYNTTLVPEIFEEMIIEVKEEKAPVEDDGWSDDDLEELSSTVDDWDDIASAYDPGEIAIIDDETGEVVDDLSDELSEEVLNEVLSRVERIRAKLRFHKSEGKRERKLKIALHRHSTSTQINGRARHMAIKLMKMRIAKKPLEQLSVAEKERVERIVAARKNVVNRLALKMTSRVRKIEKDRLTSQHTKK